MLQQDAIRNPQKETQEQSTRTSTQATKNYNSVEKTHQELFQGIRLSKSHDEWKTDNCDDDWILLSERGEIGLFVKTVTSVQTERKKNQYS